MQNDQTICLIDTHAHLDDERFEPDFTVMLDRARRAGVQKQLCVAISYASALKCIALANRHDSIYCSVGIHPNHAHEAQPGDWEALLGLVFTPKVVALGETGLDRHWDFTPFLMQQDYFSRHLALSRQTKLPLVIHCREAETDMLAMLQDDFQMHGPIMGVMHSFSGDHQFAKACLSMGLYLSFAGPLTYKNAVKPKQVAAGVPLDRILVETDAPYLTPEPMRGKVKRNEPAYVRHTAECLAALRGLSLEQIAQYTTENAERLFKM